MSEKYTLFLFHILQEIAPCNRNQKIPLAKKVAIDFFCIVYAHFRIIPIKYIEY